MSLIHTTLRRIYTIADAPRLTRFSLQAPKCVEVEFGDGRKFNLSAEFLRINSPAADGKIRSLGGEKVIFGRRHVGIMSVEPVGNYGVRLVFDDLHKTGIYPWDYFYHLGSNKREKICSIFCLITAKKQPRANYASVTDDLYVKFLLQKLLKPDFEELEFIQEACLLFIMGFRKIDSDRWEFANEGFLKDQKHLLKSIRRRKTSTQPIFQQEQPQPPCVEVGRFGIHGEFDQLKRDKQVLLMELVKLRQQQQNTKAYIQTMEKRLQGTEKKQQQMMTFLARAMQNPAFLQQLMQQKDKQRELEEAMNKKRRRPIDQGCSRSIDGASSSRGVMNHVKSEVLDFSEYGFEVSELEALALEMQGYGRPSRREPEDGFEDLEQSECGDKELDDGFWEELFNETEGVEDGEVNILTDQFGHLGSNSSPI
ncbi:hypothetical protein ACFE04_031937 [Oxalis oulophora]